MTDILTIWLQTFDCNSHKRTNECNVYFKKEKMESESEGMPWFSHTLRWKSRAEECSHMICLSFTSFSVSKLHHNASIAWSQGFYLLFVPLALQSPLDRPVYDSSTIGGLSRARDKPSLEIKVMVTKSKIIIASNSQASRATKRA